MIRIPREVSTSSSPMFAMCLIALLAALTSPLHAGYTEYTWLGAGPDDNFSTAGNWLGNVAPTDDGGAILNFPYIPGQLRAIADDGDDLWVLHGISAPSAPSQTVFEIQGNDIVLGSGGVTTGPDAVFLEFHLPISMSNEQTWSASTEVRTFDRLNLYQHRLTVSGDVHLAGEVDGTGDIVKEGDGTLTFAATNVFTGDVAVTGGTLELAAPAGPAIFGDLFAGSGPNPVLIDVQESNQLGPLTNVRLFENAEMTVRTGQSLTVQQLELNDASVEVEAGASLEASGDIITWGGTTPAEILGSITLLPGELRTIYVGNDSASPDLLIEDLRFEGNFDLQKLGTGLLYLTGIRPDAPTFNGTFYVIDGGIHFRGGNHFGGGSLDIWDGATVWAIDGEIAVDEIFIAPTASFLLGNAHINAQTIESSAAMQLFGGTLETSYVWSSEPLELDGTTLSPQGVGQCVIDADFFGNSESRILLELDASGADKVIFNQYSEMWGTLEVVLRDGYEPDPGDDFLLIEARTDYMSGYAEIVLPEVPGMELELDHQQGGVYAVFIEVPSSTDDAELTTSLQLSNAFPNPFSSSTSVVLSLPESRSVRADVFGPSGARVRSIFETRLDPGTHRLDWDGRDDNGREVGSGVYLVKVRAGADVWTRRATVIR